MWDKNSISPEIAINMSKWDKHSTWHEIIREWENAKKRDIEKFLTI